MSTQTHRIEKLQQIKAMIHFQRACNFPTSPHYPAQTSWWHHGLSLLYCSLSWICPCGCAERQRESKRLQAAWCLSDSSDWWWMHSSNFRWVREIERNSPETWRDYVIWAKCLSLAITVNEDCTISDISHRRRALGSASVSLFQTPQDESKTVTCFVIVYASFS